MKGYHLSSAFLAAVIAVTIAGVIGERTNPTILPGNPLFDGKIAVENFEIALLPSASQKSDFLMALAHERMLEAEKMIREGESWRLPESLRPMRAELLGAEETASEVGEPGIRSAQLNKVSAEALKIQSRLYDLKAIAPDQSQNTLELNIGVTDQLAQSTMSSTDYITAGFPNLASANESAVLGISDTRTDLTAVVGLLAIILIPLAVFVPPLTRKIRRRS